MSGDLYGHAPPRPTRRDPATLDRAAALLAEQLVDRFPELRRDPPDIRADLRDALEETDDADGYELAKWLETWRSWPIDANYVSYLDDGCLSEAHAELVIDWVRDNAIEPALRLGAEVTITVRRTSGEPPAPVTGFIVGIDAVRATYTVRVPSHGHVTRAEIGEGRTGTTGYVIRLEDVTPVASDAARS